ncbi:MAG: alpha/beta hydrolase [Isosphaeraceae bacterium]
MTVGFLVLGAGFLLGAVEHGEVVFHPAPEESSVPDLFRLKPEAFGFEIEPVLETPRYRVSRVRFPSPITTPAPENNVVPAEFFDPVGFPGRRPAVVVLHILGSDFPLSRYVAARLADRGVAALFLKLPYYGERRPKGGPGPVPVRFLSADIERTMTSMRQGVCDVRRGLCWLASRNNVDRRRLGVTGISLGGIVASLAVAVDPAARDGVFLLAGGDLSRILWGMPETRKFRQAWEASGKTINDLKRLTDPYDPLTYAGRLSGKRLLMIAGKVDEVIPRASTLSLWNAAGKPEILWYDCGHYSAVGYLLPAIRTTVDFLGRGEHDLEGGEPAEKPLAP